MSGQSKYRSLWETHFEQAQAIIFVVDASDDLRVAVAQNELELILENECKPRRADCLVIKAKKLPMLFFANKSDVPGAQKAAAIEKTMRLASMTDRPWHI